MERLLFLSSVHCSKKHGRLFFAVGSSFRQIGRLFLPWIHRSRLSGSAFSFAVPLPLALLLPSGPRPSGAPGPAADYSFFFAPPSLLPSLPSSFEESLNSLTPRPRPRISSGIFLPPNRSNTTNRISMSSVGPRNRGMMDNVMVYSGLWCVRFPSGLPCRIPGHGACLRTNVLRISETPLSRAKKSGLGCGYLYRIEEILE